MSKTFFSKNISKKNFFVVIIIYFISKVTYFLTQDFISFPGEPMGTPLFTKEYTYEGKVQLCPPDNVIDDMSYLARQISFGIVSVYMNSLWGSVNENSTSSFGYNQANSICKQLGFTGAVKDSVRTVNTYSSYSFTRCQSPMYVWDYKYILYIYCIFFARSFFLFFPSNF